MGVEKTVVVRGDLQGRIIVEARQTASGPWAQVAYFKQPGVKSFSGAYRELRARVSGHIIGSASADVGGDEAGCDFVDLPVPSSDGAGPAVDISDLGTDMTAIVGGGPFYGSVTVEVSQDGSQWGQAFSGFISNGKQRRNVAAKWARVRRSGHRPVAGTPIVSLGAVNDADALDSYTASQFILTAGPLILGGSDDPSAGSGVAAPVGSLYLRDDGTHWKKTGAADTSWSDVGAGGGGGMSLVAHHVVSSESGTFTLASGLSPNSIWRIVGRYKTDIADDELYLYPNGVTSLVDKTTGEMRASYTGAGPSSTSHSGIVLCRAGADTDTECFFDALFIARDGLERMLISNGFNHDNTGDLNLRDMRGIWEATPDVTQIDIGPATSPSLQAGSEFWLYRIKTS